MYLLIDFWILDLTDFQCRNYLASHSDLINAYGLDISAARDHYKNYGKNEGRLLDTFDEKIYLASHEDLINAYGLDIDGAIDHYINHGFKEGRAVDDFYRSLYKSWF